jgi:hypothetical protein
MATEIEVKTPPGERADLDAPYPPSVVDRLMAWANRLPGPVWLFYLVLLAVLILFVNGVAWLEGSVQPGKFDLYRTSLPFYPVSVLAVMHYLNRVAHRALAAFRPALVASEAEYARFEYELTTLPRRNTRAAFGLSLLFTAVFVWYLPDLANTFRRSPWLVVVDTLIYVIIFGLIAVFVYHTLRQLRLVSLIHARAENVNIFQLTPLYAFSGLTAQTGMVLLLLNYFSVLTDPTTFVNPALIGLTVFTSLAAVACFVLPLRGIHDRIVLEKKLRIAEANRRLEAVIQQVYRRADEQNLAEIDPLNQLMTSVVTTREMLDKIPTWPWETATLTGFISVFLLPFIVRLIIGLIEQLLF